MSRSHAATGSPLELDAHEHLPSLDGLRGIAVVMVVLFHVGEGGGDAQSSLIARLVFGVIAFGHVGVDLFFVLSGFLITGILLASRGKRGYFRSFYARRTLRIFPLYYLYLASLVATFALLAPVAYAALLRALPWYVLYLTNVKLVYFYDGDVGAVQHLWSLAIEEQFYLVWPAIVALLPSRGLAMFVAIAIGGIAFGRGLWLAHGAEGYAVALTTWTRADALMIGAALAIVRTRPGAWSRLVRVAPLVFVLSVLCIALPALGVPEISNDDLALQALRPTCLAATFGAALALCVERDHRGAALPLLRSRALRWLGGRSYAIYVFHFILVLRVTSWIRDAFGASLLGFAISLALVSLATLCLAELSFRFVEGPALKLKRYVPRPN